MISKSALLDNTDYREKLEYLESDLDTMDETVMAVKNNPSQFNISRIELKKRTEFIQATRQQLQKLKAGMKSGGNNKNYESISQKPDASTEERMNNELLEQQQIIQQQDKNLDQFSLAVGNIREIGLTMGAELEQQRT